MEIYSEKLGQLIDITEENTESAENIVMDDTCDSLVGWSHGGWNNDNGGAGW